MGSCERSIREYVKPRFDTRELPSASFAGAYDTIGIVGSTNLLYGDNAKVKPAR